MLRMEDYENSRPEIPGLVEADKGKKGKKKNTASTKKTLSLQNFLQDENGKNSGVESSDTIESHFAKLNLDEEELIVMESCHSFIHDMLKHMGPTNAMDPRLQQEINNFPPEAKRVIQKCGGYRNFILRSKDLTVVDKIVSARADLKLAQEMAFQEIQRNLPANHNSRNENYPTKPDNSKAVWNSKPNILSHSKSSGNIWNGANSDHQHSNAESFLNETSGNSLFYKSSSTESESAKAGYELDAANRNNAAQVYTSEISSLQKQLLQAHDRIKALTGVNSELGRRLTEKEKIQEEYVSLQSKYSTLEASYKNCKNDLELCKSELQKQRTELVALQSMSKMDNDRQMLFTIQKSLEMERLKNLNLTKELEMHRTSPLTLDAKLTSSFDNSNLSNSSLFNTSGQTSGWDHSLKPMSTPQTSSLDTDMLGIRSIFNNESSNSFQNTSSHSIQSPPPISSFSNSLFGGLIPQYQPETSLGLTPMGILEAPPHGVKPPSSICDSVSGFPPAMFSVPPPSTPSLSPPMPSASVSMSSASDTQAVTGSQAAGKAARQEQLIRKLSEMLPGADDETIKRCINELRARHGKLSGWPTSKIATHIIEMINCKTNN